MSVDTTSRAEELRNTLVDKIISDHEAKGLVMRADVERALRTVPREVFTPGVSLEEAYADTAVITKKRDGEDISSVSAPYLIAQMLGQAHGRHVLEIGSGGYNAALLREIAGPDGSVTTVDIDPEITDRARACLDAASYHDVKVVCADAEFEIEPGRTYDLIIVTAGAWDVPPAWISQLSEGGTLVVPLRILGMTRSWALQRSGNHLISRSHFQCGFVHMQGASAHRRQLFRLADGVYLRLDEDRLLDTEALGGVLSEPRREAWAGVSLPPRTVNANLDLWLATRFPDFCLLTAEQNAIAAGTVSPSWRFGTPAIADGPTLAYRSSLRWSEHRTFDLGAYAHGPDAAAAAGQFAEQMRIWAEAGCPSPTLAVFPADTPDEELPEGLLLNKRHSRLVVTWPTAE